MTNRFTKLAGVVSITAIAGLSLSVGALTPTAQATAPTSALCSGNNAFCGATLHVKNGTSTILPSKAIGAHYGPGWSIPSSANNSTGVGFCLDDQFFGTPVGPVSYVALPAAWTTAQQKQAAWLMANYAGDQVSPYQPLAIDAAGEVSGFTTRQRYMAVHLALLATVPNFNDPGYSPLLDPATGQLFSDAAGTNPSAHQVVMPLVQQMVAAAQAHSASGSDIVLTAEETSPGVITVTATKDGAPVADLPVWPASTTGLSYTGTTSSQAYANAALKGWPSLDYSTTRSGAGVTNASGQATFSATSAAIAAGVTFHTEEAPGSIQNTSDSLNSQGNITWLSSDIRQYSADVEAQPQVQVSTQISNATPVIGEIVTDALTVQYLADGVTADVQFQLFDITVDPTGAGTPLLDIIVPGLANGTTAGLAPWTATAAVAGHQIGYRERVVSTSDGLVVAPLPWSELGIVNESGLLTGTLVTHAAAVTNGTTPTVTAGEIVGGLPGIVPGQTALWDAVDYQLAAGDWEMTATVMAVTGTGPTRTCTATSITLTQTFTSPGGAGSALIGPLTIPADANLPDGAVIFESTTDPTTGEVVATHEDCADDEQFVPATTPDGYTTAGVVHAAPAAVAAAQFPGVAAQAYGLAGTSIFDVFHWDNLAPGTYTLTVNWQDKNGAVCSASAYVSTVTFTVAAGQLSGDVTTPNLPIALSDSGVYVGYETVVRDGVTYVAHSNCDDKAETVIVVNPTITTKTNTTRGNGWANWDDAIVTNVAPGVAHNIHLDVYRLVPGNAAGVTTSAVCAAQDPKFRIDYQATGSGTFRSPTYTIPANEPHGVLYVHRETLLDGSGKVVAQERCGAADEITTVVRSFKNGRLLTTA